MKPGYVPARSARLPDSTTFQTDQAPKSLRENLALFSGIVASAMDAIIVINSDQRVVVFNRAAEEMFLCPASDALGQALDQFLPEKSRANHKAHIQAFARTGSTSRRMGALGARQGAANEWRRIPD